MYTRTDTIQSDVFISWTGKDREIKNQIVAYLKGKSLSVLESDESCSGDYRQWSREAVGACSIFVPIITEHTKNSTYVPMEIDAAKELDDYQNRIVPVCQSDALYQKESFGMNDYCSAVYTDEKLSEDVLDQLYSKVNSLLINRFYSFYKETVRPSFVRLIPLWAGLDEEKVKDAPFASIYINRTVSEYDQNNEVKKTLNKPDDLIRPGAVSFIHGAAGSGKTQFFYYIASTMNESCLPLVVSCAKLNDFNGSVYDYLYNTFYDAVGRTRPYSKNNFSRLLEVKKLLLLFDGLDEIPNQAATRRLIGKIEEFYKTVQDKTALIFSSRNGKDANSVTLCGKQATLYELDKLSDVDIASLTNNLFLIFDEGENYNEFYSEVSKLDDEIKANPLLLTQLAIVYHVRNKVPKTTFGILDAVAEITLNLDNEKGVANTSFLKRLRQVLKCFAKEKYQLLSVGKQIETIKIFRHILKPQCDDYEAKADFFAEYLKNREILIDGEFYHKMFLEYFTATAYYDEIFNDYDEIENEELLKELLSHYSDPYWSPIIKLFLSKADCEIDKKATEELYTKVVEYGNVSDYDLLFDACCDLTRQKVAAELTLVTDILYKSAEQIYQPYGPLFYYVPEYELYAQTIKAAERLKGNAKALALARDVCFIFGHFDSSDQVTAEVDGLKLYNAAKPQLSGVRNALCELFFTGETDYEGGDDIYPRCFNVAESKSMKKCGTGVLDREPIEFEDELLLFLPKNSYSQKSDDLVGMLFLAHDKEIVNQLLTASSVSKLTGIVYRNTETDFPFHIEVTLPKLKLVYLPENVKRPKYTEEGYRWHECYKLINYIYISPKGIQYHRIQKSKLVLDETVICDGMFEFWRGIDSISLRAPVETIEKHAFAHCSSLKTIDLPASVTRIEDHAFYDCRALTKIVLPDTISKLTSNLFEGCSSLETLLIPEKVIEIQEKAFRNCTALRCINVPNEHCSIANNAFEGCKCKVFLNNKLHVDYGEENRPELSLTFRSDDGEFTEALERLTEQIKEGPIESVPKEIANEAKDELDRIVARKHNSERDLFLACACLIVMLRNARQSEKRYVEGKDNYIERILQAIADNSFGSSVHINYEYQNSLMVYISFSGFLFSFARFPYKRIEMFKERLDATVRYDNIKKQEHAMTIYKTAKELALKQQEGEEHERRNCKEYH